jgi:hypothetical protein
MKIIRVNNFSLGMANDPRTPDSRLARLIQHFDCHTNPTRLVPFRSHETGDSAASTHQISNYVYTGATLYGLGVVSGTAKPQIYTTTDFTGDTWTQTADNSGTSGAVSFPLFVFYKTTGLIYGAKAGTTLWSYDVSGNSYNNSEQSLTYTTIAQGLVHSKNDILYVPYDNNIASNNDGSWNTAALTLPANFTVTSICEYGNYLAIGCKNNDAGGKSVVFLWDMDETLTTVSESIDWGNGDLEVIETVEGVLVGISTTGGSSISLNPKVVFKQYTGAAGAETLFELQASDATVVIGSQKQKVNNKLYFLLSIELDGTTYQGVWKFGRASTNLPFGVAFDRLPNNDTALTSGLLNGFYLLGDFMYILYQDNGSYGMSKTDDQPNFNVTSTYESLINPGMAGTDRSARKTLGAVSVSFAPLSGDQQVVLDFRIDGGEWTEIFTKTASSPDTDLVTYRTTNAQGTPFGSGTEFEFRIQSTKGAEITEFAYGYTPVATAI